MLFTPTELPGAYVIELDKREDSRGFFARAWCRHEFEAHGLSADLVQANVSMNIRVGTLRGMHYQLPPYAEAKIIRCTRGALYDVIIDLRPHSSTYGKWIGVELTAESHRMLYVPELFAHGFQTLMDDTEAFYLVSHAYTPGAERGIRYDDPAFRISWPQPIRAISEKDQSWPDYRFAEREVRI